MSNAREEILDSIRRNLAASKPFDKVHAEHTAHQEKFESLTKTSDLKNENLVEIFQENLLLIGGNCEIAANSDETKNFIEKIIEAKNARTIAISDTGLVVEIAEKINADFTQNASREELFDYDIGITSAQFGIAETGTLVLESDREFNRLTSLIPPVHICILKAENLRKTMGEVLSETEKDLSRAITFITGPSRTSDIELTLAIGVHGPAELHVIILEGTN